MNAAVIRSGNRVNCQLAVVGTGMAGMAAAIFAANRGLSVVQAGKASEISFSSGCLDLFSGIPGAERFENPFKGIEALIARQPNHPYARVSRDEIVHGFEEFTGFMNGAGIRYHCTPETNQQIITPAGTLKSTWCVPSAMIAGTRALAGKQRILIVDIRGLKGFGARQMAQNLKAAHPCMGSVTVEFPGREKAGDLMCERLTWDLETPDVLSRFIKVLRPHVGGYDAVGLPAILGIYRFEELRAKMEKALGTAVFEIPTLAPSVTGMRTKEAYLGQLSETAVRHFPVSVKEIQTDDNGFCFNVAEGMNTLEIRAEHLIVATGRFLGRGLGVNDKGIIKEMLFDLPVTQTAKRSDWFHRDFFNVQGHPVNRAGIETDEVFRPLGRDGKIRHPKLYAAGSIIAHQDWKREKSGSGISIVSAYKAVNHLAKVLKGS
ncbi:MAG: glycerol-3-phosphate dehydrogenase subunit GlpB [Desulfobacterales bacterium]|nr:glycerol-3-phosphate dehydrogenase subunit GlpB [Desulfobacterales bacterium]